MKAMSLSTMGEAVSVPGPLPLHPDEPRPLSLIALLSQPVAVIEAHGGRLLPISVGRVLVGVSWVGTGIEAVPHPPIMIAASSRTTDLTALDIPMYAATAAQSDPSLLVCKLGNGSAQRFAPGEDNLTNGRWGAGIRQRHRP